MIHKTFSFKMKKFMPYDVYGPFQEFVFPNDMEWHRLGQDGTNWYGNRWEKINPRMFMMIAKKLS